LLALCDCAPFFALDELCEELSLLALLLTDDALSLAEWFSEPLRVEEELLFFVTLELLLLVNWLFWPRV
jgi:hypothetical protein